MRRRQTATAGGGPSAAHRWPVRGLAPKKRAAPTWDRPTRSMASRWWSARRFGPARLRSVIRKATSTIPAVFLQVSDPVAHDTDEPGANDARNDLPLQRLRPGAVTRPAQAPAELQIASTGFLDPSKGISAKQGRRRLGTSQ